MFLIRSSTPARRLSFLFFSFVRSFFETNKFKTFDYEGNKYKDPDFVDSNITHTLRPNENNKKQRRRNQKNKRNHDETTNVEVIFVYYIR